MDPYAKRRTTRVAKSSGTSLKVSRAVGMWTSGEVNADKRLTYHYNGNLRLTDLPAA
jgi:hypothetical protein